MTRDKGLGDTEFATADDPIGESAGERVEIVAPVETAETTEAGIDTVPSVAGKSDQQVADGLRTVMDRISSRIEQAGSRSEDAIAEVRDRLSIIGERTAIARDQAPNECSDAFARIESQLAALTRHVGSLEPVRGRDEAAPVADEEGEGVELAGSQARTPVIDHGDIEKAKPRRERAPASVAESGAETLKAEAVIAPDFETEVEIRTGAEAAGDDMDWDAESAEALARIYDGFSAPTQADGEAGAASDEPGEPMSVALDAPDCSDQLNGPGDSSEGLCEFNDTEIYHVELNGSAQPESALAGNALTGNAPLEATSRDAAPVDVAPTGLGLLEGTLSTGNEVADGDHAWLEHKLAEVAARIEQRFDESRIAPALSSLETQFNAIESKFDALCAKADETSATATMSAIETMVHGLESRVVDLTSQLEAVAGEASRIELIEGGIAQLIERAERSDDELSVLADAAAERVLSGVLASDGSAIAAAEAQPGGRISALEDLMQTYFAERRDSDSRTDEALESLHGAIQTLTRRMEDMSAAVSGSGASAMTAAMAVMTGNEFGAQARADDLAPAPQTGVDAGVDAELAAESDERAALADAARSAAARRAASRRAAQSGAFTGEQPVPGRAPHAKQGVPADLQMGAVGAGDLVPDEHGHGDLTDDASIDDAPVLEPYKPAASDKEAGGGAGADQHDFLASARKAAQVAVSKRAIAEAGDKAKKSRSLFSWAKRNSAKKGGKKAGGRSLFSLQRSGPRPVVIVAAAALLTASLGLLVNKLVNDDAAANKAAAISPAIGASVMPKASDLAPKAAKLGAPAPVGTSLPPAKVPARRSVRLTVPSDVEVRKLKSAMAAAPAPAPAPALTTKSTPPGGALEIAAGADFGGLAGIAIAPPRGNPDLRRIYRAYDRRRIAKMSAGLVKKGKELSPTEISLSPSLSLGVGTAPASDPSPKLDMPGARVGPLSLRLAAAKGDPRAQFHVASRFAQGNGVKKDYGEAAKWFKRAAAQGLAPAQYRLAALYEQGNGVKKDLARARIWYERAANLGNVKAMHNLAVLYTSSAAGKPDYRAAAKWFEAAASHGLTDSQFNLAIMRQNGLGVSADAVEAYKWYTLAARGGDRQASAQRDRLRGRLDRRSLTLAERKLRSWRRRAVNKSANQVALPS